MRLRRQATASKATGTVRAESVRTVPPVRDATISFEEHVRAALRALTARERQLLYLRFVGEHCSRHEAAQRLRVTHGRVRQIEARALAKLRANGQVASKIGSEEQ